jgi:membrane protein implicated in regulation of membrane protease activity
VVPADADLLAWRQALEHQRAQHERQRWFGPLVIIPATALSLWLTLTDAPYWWVGVALFVGVLVAFMLSTPRVLRRTRTMLAELDRRSAQRTDG